MNKKDEPPPERRIFKAFINEPEFLNIDGIHTCAAIKVDFFADGFFSILITDCDKKITLEDNIINHPKNAIHKIDTIIKNITLLKNHVAKAIKTGPTEKVPVEEK